jgi:hypothetical protein
MLTSQDTPTRKYLTLILVAVLTVSPLVLARDTTASTLPVRTATSTPDSPAPSSPPPLPALPPGATPAQTPTPVPTPTPAALRSYSISPKEMQIGKTNSFSITADDKGDLPDNLKIDDKSASGLTVESQGIVNNKKTLAVKLKTDENASSGAVQLNLFDGAAGQETLIGSVSLNLTRRLERGPTPDDISEVDAMWSVLPYKVVKSNFGRRAADNFYGIEVYIGNNSGYDMQIVGVGFNTSLGRQGPQAFDKDGKPISDRNGAPLAYKLNSEGQRIRAEQEQSKSSDQGEIINVTYDGWQLEPLRSFQVPTSDHRLVRGSIEMDQLYGTRAGTLNLLSGFGTLFSGFIPFYRNANPKANFSTFSSILNGNLREGFGLAAPDMTVNQLNRLENLVMHEGLTIQNNSQARTVVFFPRHVVHLTDTERKWIDDGKGLSALMEKLGTLIIVGNPLLKFKQREIVASRPESAPPTVTPPTVPAPTITGATRDPANPTNLLITGTNLSNARVTVGGVPANVRAGVTSGSLIAEVPANAPSGEVVVETPGGRQSISTFVAAPRSVSIDKSKGKVGDPVVVTGENFAPDTIVKFGKIPVNAADYQREGTNKITVKVPPRTRTSVVSVETPSLPDAVKRAATSNAFTPAPEIDDIKPSSAGAGAEISIEGINFTGAKSVKFGTGESATPTVKSDELLTVIVPKDAASGTISVVTDAGTGESQKTFTFLPLAVITNLTSETVPVNTPVDIIGSNLAGASEVKVGTVVAEIVGTPTATKITIKVPTAVNAGKISITTPAGSAISDTKTLTVTAATTPTTTQPTPPGS